MNLKGLMSKTLVRNAAWMLYGQGARIVLQALYFVVLARALGAVEFGALAATAALGAIFGTFSGMGSGDVLVMRVSRDRGLFPVYFGNALLMTVVSSLPLGALFAAVAIWMLPDAASVPLVTGLILAEFVFGRALEQCSQAFVAVDRHRYTAHIFALSAAIRASGAVVFMYWGAVSAEQWALWLAALNAAALLACLWLTVSLLGRPRIDVPRALRETRNGIHFSIGLGARTVYSDIDKAMLGRLATLDAAGAYTAAYRLVAMAFVPIGALLYAATSRFFVLGQHGVDSVLQWGRRLLPLSIGYGVAVGGGIYLCAPLVPLILGEDYSASVDVLRWLSLVPVIQAVHFVLADVLTGANQQPIRSAIQIAVAALNVGLCYWLISDYGLVGACWAAIASESLLGALFLVAIFYLKRRQLRREQMAMS